MAGLRLVEAAQALGGKRDRFDNLGIAGAAADVAGNGFDDVLARRRGVFLSSSAWAARIIAGVQ